MALMRELRQVMTASISQVLRFTAESPALQMTFSVLTAPVFHLLHLDKPAIHFWKAEQKRVLWFSSRLLPSHQLVFSPSPLTHGSFSALLPPPYKPGSLAADAHQPPAGCPPPPLSLWFHTFGDENQKIRGEGEREQGWPDGQ